MTIIFYKKKKMKDKQLILEEVAGNLFGKVKENFFPRYYTIKIAQSKSGLLYIVVRLSYIVVRSS